MLIGYIGTKRGFIGMKFAENGVKLIEDVNWVNWYKKGVYKYEIDGKEYNINLNINKFKQN